MGSNEVCDGIVQQMAILVQDEVVGVAIMLLEGELGGFLLLNLFDRLL